MLLRKLSLIGALALPALVDSASCFLPDGSVNATDVPCISRDGTSRCCAPDELCSSNLLCVSKADHNKFSRGSCLDKNFGSTCPNFCKGINDSGKVTVLPCGSPSLGQFCCDDGKGFQCCATQTSILTLGVGTTTFSEEGAIKFTSMSKSSERSTETTTSKITTSQTSSDVQISSTTTTSLAAAAPTSTSAPLTTSIAETPIASSTAAVSTSIDSSFQNPSPVQSQQAPNRSALPSPETTFAPQQSTVAASTSTFQVQSSVESQLPDTTSVQPLPSTTLALSSTAAVPESEVSSAASSISSPFSVASTALITQSAGPSNPLASQRLSQVSPPIQLTSVGYTLTLSFCREILTLHENLRSSTLSVVPQSISVSSSSAQASSAATSLAAGIVASSSTTPRKGSSAAVVAGASVASVLVVTGLFILGLFLYRKRKAKRLSKRFEASLGRTNIENEKGSIRSGRSGLLGGLGGRRVRSGESDRSRGSLNSPFVNSPILPAPVAARSSWRPPRPPRPEMVPSQASSTFRRLLYDVQSKPF